MRFTATLLFCALVLAACRPTGNVRAAAKAIRTAHHIVLSNGLLEVSIPLNGGQPDGIFLLRSGRKIRLANSMYFDANGGPDHIPAARRNQQTKKGHFALFRLHNIVQIVPSHMPGAAEVEVAVRPHFWFPFHIVIHYMLP